MGWATYGLPVAIGRARERQANQLPTVPFLGWEIYRLRPPMGSRLGRLLPGLVLFGIAIAFSIRADFGNNPWTVLAEGLSNRTGLSVGTLILLIGVVLVASTRLFKEPFGIGTVLNAVIIGPVVDVTMAVIPEDTGTIVRLVLLFLAPLLLGIASGLYIGAGLGPGPRDSLMTALIRRGFSARWSRTMVEALALLAGVLLGGTAGLGTVWMALAVGPWVQVFLGPLSLDR